MCLAIDHHLFLDARVHLDRVVDPYAEHHGEAGDRDDRQRYPEVTGEPERPHDADEDHGQGEQSPAHVEEHEQDHDHDGDGDRAERQHAAREVVVDVLEQHRRAGRDVSRVGELEVLSSCDDLVRRGAFGRDRRVADEARHHLRVRVVDDERAQPLANLSLVVVQEEVDPRRVVERAFGLRHRVQPLQRGRRVRVPRRLTLGGRVPSRRAEERLARDALGRIA